jgi:hypothetical protein
MIVPGLTSASLSLDGELTTNSQGIRRLLMWYDEASQQKNTIIHTHCDDLDWLDANLAALWSALMHKLGKENNLEFELDTAMLSRRFSILIRNGFQGSAAENKTASRTFIQNASFAPQEDERFLDYVDTELLQQRELKKLPLPFRSLLEGNLYELYTNVHRHAGTDEPLFVCGQYYPGRKELVVSLVDLGQTFLPPIQRRTQGQIKTQEEAIEWALMGNSEKTGLDGGGHALKCIRQEFAKAGHFLQIVTGDAFWDSSATTCQVGPYRHLPVIMPGTMVNMTFSTKFL